MKRPHPHVASPVPNSHLTRSVLESLPSAVVLWNGNRTACIVNCCARELFGFRAGELEADPLLWINSIHSEDRGLYRAAWKKLLAGAKTISCDYRLNRGEKELWIRDVSVCRDMEDGGQGITSIYMDVSDLRRERRKTHEEGHSENVAEIVDNMVHEIK